MGDAGQEPLDRLPPDTRARLDQFGQALERIPVDDLLGYAVRHRQPDHRRAVEAAASAVHAADLDEPAEAARQTIAEFVSRAYGAAQFRTSWVAMNSAPGLGPTDDRVRVMRSLDDAVTALVAWDALDEVDRAEALGRWGELVR
jgi:hypothetical protein